MLTPHDDFPIHQTPLPIAHPVSGDANHYDRYWFNGYTKDGSTFFAAAMGHYPNRGVIDGAFSVIRDGVQRSVFVSGRMPLDRSTTIGPYTVSVLEPLRKIRLQLSPNDHGVTADIVFDAVTVAIEEPRQSMNREGRSSMDSTRLTQWGRWSGEIVVDGEKITLAASQTYGTRDRSWGARNVGVQAPNNVLPASPQIFWLWAPLHFDSFCTHAAAFEHSNGHRWMSAARYIPHLASSASPTWGEDPTEHLNWWDYDIAWKPGTREIERCAITMKRLNGSPISLDFEPLVTFRMRGIGYTHPHFSHGSAHGDLEVGGESIDLTSVDHGDPTMIHVQTLSRIHSNLGDGMGVLEQLVFGDHAPTGLVGAFAGYNP